MNLKMATQLFDSCSALQLERFHSSISVGDDGDVNYLGQ